MIPPLRDPTARPACAPLRSTLHRRCTRPRGPALPAPGLDSGQLPDPRVLAPVRRSPRRGRRRPIAITKEAKDLWRADPADAPLTVIARVYAYDVSVRTAYLDATRGYFNGACVFLCPEGREGAPCTVDILPPEGPGFAHWRVATTLALRRGAATGFRPLSRSRLRRTDRSPGRTRGFHARELRGRRSPAPDRAHRSPRCRSRADDARPRPRSASGRTTSSAAGPQAVRLSIATCSWSRRWAAATAASSTDPAPACCARARNCRGAGTARSATTT